jgi:uncharacterized membrane protein
MRNTSTNERPQVSPVPPPVAAIVHIYRGLMDRSCTWRQRIDASTNWAIVTSGTAVSFVLSDPAHPHVVLLLVMLLINAFLIIEARRMRYYDLWSSWVRLMESEYLAPILRDTEVAVNATWQHIVVRDLDFPHFKSSFWSMVGQRLRDNYLAIHLFLISSWLLKLSLHPRADLPPGLPDNIINRAGIGAVSGLLVMGAVVAFYAAALLFTLLTASGDPGTEVLGCERVLQKLTSPDQKPVNPHPYEPRYAALGEKVSSFVDLTD